MPKSKRPAPRRRAVRRSGGTMPSRGKVKSTSRSAPAALARSSPARVVRAKSTRESETIAPRGKYVYCIIQSGRPLRFDAAGIADERAEVHTVGYRDLAAVVSDVPIGVVDSTRENVLAHERVNEIVMREHTVIPMSFGTIFKTRDDIVELLRSAQDAFGDVLNKMRDKMEFGLKVLWDRDSIIQEIEQEDEDINRLKKEIALQKGLDLFRENAVRPCHRCRPAVPIGAICRGNSGSAAQRGRGLAYQQADRRQDDHECGVPGLEGPGERVRRRRQVDCLGPRQAHLQIHGSLASL